MERFVFIFDADDTLWENQELFEEFEKEWENILLKYDIDLKKASEYLKELDLECFKLGKFGNIYFLESMEKTLKKFLSPDILNKELVKIRMIHDDIFLKPPRVHEGIEKVLSFLKKHNQIMYILTKGHYSTQKRKIEESGLEDYFNGFIVVNNKNIETYKRIENQYGFSPNTTVMIGNSPKSDINPPLKLGWFAIFFERTLLWDFETEELLNSKRLYRVKSAFELLNIIKEKILI